MQRKRVKLANRIADEYGLKNYKAYSDCKDTYCCSFERCWFVSVYENNKMVYDGYFKVSDLILLKVKTL